MRANALAPTADARLAELEATIERDLGAMRRVAGALAAIHAERLYRATHPTFEAYCEERWGFTGRHGRQLIAWDAIQATIGTRVPIPTERHARALAPVIRLHGPERAAEVWERLNADGPPTVEATRQGAAEAASPPRPKHGSLRLWKPDPPLNGPAATEWRQAKLERGDETGPCPGPETYYPRQETEADAEAVAPVLARIEAFSQALVDDLFAVPLGHDWIALRRAREALKHLEYRLACRQWATGDEPRVRWPWDPSGTSGAA